MTPSMSHVQRTEAPPNAGPTRTQGESMALVIAALVIGCVGIYYIRSLFGPAFFALTLVITVRPLTAWASRHGVPRPLAAGAAIALIYAFVIGLFVALGVAVAQLIETLPTYSTKFESLWDQMQGLLVRFGIDHTVLVDQVSSAVSTERVVSVAQSLMGQLTSFASALMILALTVVFLVFDLSKVEVRARALSRLKPGIATALADFAGSVRSYWLVSTIFGLIVAVLDTIALGILGVPMAVTWGVLSFITNYIPNVGFVLGLIPPALLALVDSGPWTALWVVVAYAVLNFVIQSLIQPKFTGDAVGLNTTTTFLSLIFWSSVVGGLGTILAIPLTLFCKALLIDSDPRSQWLTLFMAAGDRPVQEPDPLDPAAIDRLDPDGDGPSAQLERGDEDPRPGDGEAADADDPELDGWDVADEDDLDEDLVYDVDDDDASDVVYADAEDEAGPKAAADAEVSADAESAAGAPSIAAGADDVVDAARGASAPGHEGSHRAPGDSIDGRREGDGA